MLLSLPTLSPAIPTTYRTGTLGTRQLKMVLVMSRLGLLTDDDLAGITDKSISAASVLAILTSAWKRVVGEVYDFGLSSVFATLCFPAGEDIGVCEEDDALYAAAIYEAARPEWIAGGKVFEALEAECPSLGKTVMSELDSVLSYFGCPHTLVGVLDMCSMTEWMGEGNEDLAKEELDDDADIVKFADVVSGIPEWAYTFDSAVRPLSAAQLRKQGKRLKNPKLGHLVEVIARLSQLTQNARLFTEIEQEYEVCEPPVVIGWNDPDQFNQYIDIYQNYYMQGESGPWVGCIRFEISEKGLSEAIAQICHTGHVLKALDEALILLRDVNNEL